MSTWMLMSKGHVYILTYHWALVRQHTFELDNSKIIFKCPKALPKKNRTNQGRTNRWTHPLKEEGQGYCTIINLLMFNYHSFFYEMTILNFHQKN